LNRIEAYQYGRRVIRPTLEHLGVYSDKAHALLLGTALAESHLDYVQQFNGGPGRGYYQMETATHDDIWDNFLEFRPALAAKVRALLVEALPRGVQLEGNGYYATAMARVHYMRVREHLPKADDPLAMVTYWKTYYNTHLGAGTVEKALAAFDLASKCVLEGE
jgi:hypothetical protein